MKSLRKPITKRRRRIIRGGDIDNDVNELINNLNNYDPNSIADLLEELKGNDEFKKKLIEKNGQFAGKLSTCKYMETFDKFVNEMLITAINKLRETKPTDEIGSSPKPVASFDDIGKLYQGKNIDELIGALMNRYFLDQGRPCLQVDGNRVKLNPRPTQQQQQKQQFSLRTGVRTGVRAGGSRRKKSIRLRRRKQRGGLEPIISALILTGIVFACCFIIGVVVHITRTPDYTRS